MKIRREAVAGVFEASGIGLLCAVLFSYVLTNAGLILGFSVSSFSFPVAVILGVWIACRRLPKRKWALLSAIVPGYILLSLLLEANAFDTSHDGIFYHQQTVVSLVDGWNPFRVANLTDDYSLWTCHYAKAIETIAASIVAFCGNIEAGKSVNMLLYGSSLFLMCGVCLQMFQGRKTWLIVLCAIAIVSNPVVISQMFTYYVDYPKYIYLLWTIWLIYRLSQRKGDGALWSFLLCGVVILAIGTKFNLFFDNGLWLILAFVWFAFHRDKEMMKTLVIIGIVSLVCGVLLAWHPYVTNIFVADNPLYPLLGDNSVDIMTGNTPEELGSNRFINFLISLFTINWPTYDRRLGGFGPLMPVAVVLSLYILWRERRRTPSWMLYAALCCVATVFIFAQSWWARYNGQLWLLPAIALFVGFKAKKLKIATYGLLVVMLLTIPLALARDIRALYVIRPYYTTLYDQLKGKDVEIFHNESQFQKRLEANGVNVKPIDVLTDEKANRAWSLYGFRISSAKLDHAPILVVDSVTSAALTRELKLKGLNPLSYRPTESDTH